MAQIFHQSNIQNILMKTQKIPKDELQIPQKFKGFRITFRPDYFTTVKNDSLPTMHDA